MNIEKYVLKKLAKKYERYLGYFHLNYYRVENIIDNYGDEIIQIV